MRLAPVLYALSIGREQYSLRVQVFPLFTIIYSFSFAIRAAATAVNTKRPNLLKSTAERKKLKTGATGYTAYLQCYSFCHL